VELIIVPFFIPLLLVGRLVDAWRAFREERARRRPIEPVPEERWLATWFRRNGPPMLSALACLAVPQLAEAREPLPTIEVVQPKPKRVRLLDVRGPLQFGGGFSTLWRAPVYHFSFEAQASFVELGHATWLHLTFGENLAIVPYPLRHGQRRPGLLGADLGLGVSRYATGGPAFVLDVTAGPRWDLGGNRWQPEGVGVIGRADVYPFFMSVPEIVKTDRRWFRKYVLSGLHFWVTARYDRLRTADGGAYLGGVGLDVGRALLLPILTAVR
jgi:hypothetical protein